MNRHGLFTAFLAVSTLHYPVAAQAVPARSRVVAIDPLVCISGKMPGRNRETGDVHLRIPASKLEKFTALGFAETACDLPGKAFPAAGLTVCQMRARPNGIPDTDFRNAHKISLAQVCDRNPRQ